MSAPAPGRRLPHWVRWLHVYVSMFGCCSTLLFAVTGLTLNHADWFEDGEPSVRVAAGELPRTDLVGDVDRLQVAESLRAAHHLRGTVTTFSLDDEQCLIVWKGPGYSADVTVARDTGAYRLEESRRSWLAVLDDLHKGRDCGPVWAIAIDVAAIVLAALSATGLWLLLYLKKRRRTGLLVALGGAVLLFCGYAIGTP